jgi:hypothetical protein
MRKRLSVIVGVCAAAALFLASFAGATSLAASADQEPQTKAKKYKATRAFVVDKESGEIRMPTQEEVDQLVANLSELGQRADDTLPRAVAANGTEFVDAAGAFGGIMLGRPNGDGTWTTLCVFTLEEGANFLGLVVDESIR